MFAPAAELALLYADGELVVPDVGTPFRGFLSTPDDDVFGASAQVGDYTLQFPADAASLPLGLRLSIDGEVYVVAAPVRRIGDGAECVAPLARAD